MVWTVACVSLNAANNSYHKKPKQSTQKSEVLSEVKRKDKTEEPKMQLIFPSNNQKRGVSVLRYNTQPCATTKIAEKFFMLLEQVIFSYSVETIYEESGYFWDLLEA